MKKESLIKKFENCYLEIRRDLITIPMVEAHHKRINRNLNLMKRFFMNGKKVRNKKNYKRN